MRRIRSRILKDLSNFELDRLPYLGLQGALEKAGKLRLRTTVSGSARADWLSRPAVGRRRENGYSAARADIPTAGMEGLD